jgi:hypothetical protein
MTCLLRYFHKCGKSAETVNTIENVITDDNPLFVRGGWGPGRQSTNHVTTMNRLLASKAYDVFRATSKKKMSSEMNTRM